MARQQNPKEPILGDGAHEGTFRYPQWQPLAQAKVESKGLGVVFKKLAEGEVRSEDVMAKESMALAIIKQLSGRYINVVLSCATTLEAFDKLRVHVEGSPETRSDKLQAQLQEQRLLPGESIRDYFLRAKDMHDQLVELGFYPDQKLKNFLREPVHTITKTLARQQKEYSEIRHTMLAKYEKPTFSEAMDYYDERISELRACEQVAGAGVPAAATVAVAGAVNNSGRGASGGAGRSSAAGNQGSSHGGPKNRSDIVCWSCNMPGHFSSQCPNPQARQQVPQGTNYGGGGSSGGGQGRGNPQQQQQGQGGWQPQQGQGGWQQQQRQGGWPQQQQQQQRPPAQQLQQPRWNSASSGHTRQQPPAAGGGGPRRLEYRMSAAATSSSTEWLVDSGAFATLTYDRSDIWGIRDLDEPVKVQFGQGQPMSVTQHGRMNLVTQVDGEERLLRFNSVLFMPAARVKALSVVDMGNMGLATTFFSGVVTCTAPSGELVMQGWECNRTGVYVVDGFPERPNEEEEAEAAAADAAAAAEAAAAQRTAAAARMYM